VATLYHFQDIIACLRIKNVSQSFGSSWTV